MKKIIFLLFVTVGIVSCQAQQPFPQSFRLPISTVDANPQYLIGLDSNDKAVKVSPILQEPGVENQTLSISGNNLTISNGNTVTLPAPVNGANGQDGADGKDGIGVPTGGATGQILAKASGTNYDTQWINAPTGGGGSATGPYVPTAYNVTADRNLIASDIGNIIRCTNSATLTITEDFADMQVNEHVNLEAHNGAGLKVQAGTGVTLNYALESEAWISSRPLSFMVGMLIKIGENEYVITGQ